MALLDLEIFDATQYYNACQSAMSYRIDFGLHKSITGYLVLDVFFCFLTVLFAFFNSESFEDLLRVYSALSIVGPAVYGRLLLKIDQKVCLVDSQTHFIFGSCRIKTRVTVHIIEKFCEHSRGDIFNLNILIISQNDYLADSQSFFDYG